VIVEVSGADHMLFKHAIASIRTPRAVANYFTHN
jgi:sRNA-binding regulator protein Hfq